MGRGLLVIKVWLAFLNLLTEADLRYLKVDCHMLRCLIRFPLLNKITLLPHSEKSFAIADNQALQFLLLTDSEECTAL